MQVKSARPILLTQTYFFLIQVLLDLVRVIFEEQHTVAILIKKIMMHTQSLLKCEVCQVLLVKENSKVNKLSPFHHLLLVPQKVAMLLFCILH